MLYLALFNAWLYMENIIAKREAPKNKKNMSVVINIIISVQ